MRWFRSSQIFCIENSLFWFCIFSILRHFFQIWLAIYFYLIIVVYRSELGSIEEFLFFLMSLYTSFYVKYQRRSRLWQLRKMNFSGEPIIGGASTGLLNKALSSHRSHAVSCGRTAPKFSPDMRKTPAYNFQWKNEFEIFWEILKNEPERFP